MIADTDDVRLLLSPDIVIEQPFRIGRIVEAIALDAIAGIDD